MAKVALPRLEVGLVNNMPDAALCAAERQFGCALEAAAAGAYEIRLRLFFLEGVERGALARARMAGRYETAAGLNEAGLDAVIVTGAEPRAERLTDEACWGDLERLVEDIAEARLACFWSCLAAHAAVLCLDGVERRRLEAKRTGVFAWERVGEGLPGLPRCGATPHSRYNDLAAEDLAAKGYEIVSVSPQAGVDVFAGRRGGPCLFVQGHPEYEADTLAREWRRDHARWLEGAAPPPATPVNYFPAAFEATLPSGLQELGGLTPTRDWTASARAIFRGFLDLAAREKLAGSPRIRNKASVPPL